MDTTECLRALENFIVKGNKVVNETTALQALNILSNCSIISGTHINSKEYTEVETRPPSGRLLEEEESLPREGVQEGNSEEKLIDSSLTQIRNIAEVESNKQYKAEIIHSLNVVEYYIKGLSKISKKFEKEYGKSKNQEILNNDKTSIKSELNQAQSLISKICDEIKEMLLDKNRKYGNSALSPKRIFSKASPIEQINVRIDDKLSRIESAQPDDMEDPVFDLLGYLVLRRVAEKINKEK